MPIAAADELLQLARTAFADGDAAAAEAAWRQSLALDPANPEACFHLGNLSRGRGDAAAAIEHYERGLRRAPGHTGLLNNLGQTLEMLGGSDRAETCYRDALATEPWHLEALANLARLLFERGQFAAATAAYDRLLEARRELSPPMWLQRGIAQQHLGDLRSAERSFREAERLAPHDPTIQLDLASLCSVQERWAETDSASLRVLAVDPQNAYALSLLVHSRQQRCEWEGLDELFSRVERISVAAPEHGSEQPKATPFGILSMPVSPQTQQQVARRWASGFVRQQARPPAFPARAPGEPLRVGFVSSDFRDHPTAFLWTECWERLDRERIETFGYAIFPADRGAIGARIAKAFAHFVDVSGEPVERIAERIRDDRIDILFDLNGYTRHSREGIFAMRPAPVQVNAIGFPGTTGAPWYDYIFTDRRCLPEHLRGFYDEQPLYMPHMAYPSDTTRLPPGPPPSRAACGLPAQGFVFCCFNSAYKILPEVFAIWMRLLAAVPGSVLWLLEANAEAKSNLQHEAQQAGIAAERLIFAPRVSLGEHLARIAAADLFLDTYPYGAHTTANDALLAGLPLLTCVGQTLASRIAGSQLLALGLPELITESFADYEALALKLGREPDLLARYRQRLAANRRTHPLFDMPRWVRDFEQLMQRVWDDYAGTSSATSSS